MESMDKIEGRRLYFSRSRSTILNSNGMNTRILIYLDTAPPHTHYLLIMIKKLKIQAQRLQKLLSVGWDLWFWLDDAMFTHWLTQLESQFLDPVVAVLYTL